MSNDKNRPTPNRDGSRVGEPSTTPGNPAGDAVFTADHVSAQFKITVRALHYYEALGLIKPQRQGSIRIYSQRDCDRIALIVKDRKLAGVFYELGQLMESAGVQGSEAYALGGERVDQQIKALEIARSEISVVLAELRRIHTIMTVKMAGRGDGST